jgi:hypothetical protein
MDEYQCTWTPCPIWVHHTSMRVYAHSLACLRIVSCPKRIKYWGGPADLRALVQGEHYFMICSYTTVAYKYIVEISHVSVHSNARHGARQIHIAQGAANLTTYPRTPRSSVLTKRAYHSSRPVQDRFGTETRRWSSPGNGPVLQSLGERDQDYRSGLRSRKFR